MGSNRTFMELKFVECQIDKAAEERSNRTFMELKYTMRAQSASDSTF